MSRYSVSRSVNGHEPVERSVYRNGRLRSFWECDRCGETAEIVGQFARFECEVSRDA